MLSIDQRIFITLNTLKISASYCIYNTCNIIKRALKKSHKVIAGYSNFIFMKLYTHPCTAALVTDLFCECCV